MSLLTSWARDMFRTYTSKKRRASASASVSAPPPAPPPAPTEVTFTLPWLDHIPESRDSLFFKALSAPYTLGTNAPRTPQELFIEAIQWTPSPSPEASDSSEPEDARKRKREETIAMQTQLDGLISAYKPDQAFAWAMDKPLTDIEKLRQMNGIWVHIALRSCGADEYVTA